MRIAKKPNREHRTAYKKRETTWDPYNPRGAKGKVLVCDACHAVYRNKRWYADEGLFAEATHDPTAEHSTCPACTKMRDDFPGGIVTLKGDFLRPHKQDVLNLIKNEEGRARGFNPLERVMSVKENDEGSIVIATTNEKLAQRLGRALKKAFNGVVAYRWSRDTKLVRVDWERAA